MIMRNKAILAMDIIIEEEGTIQEGEEDIEVVTMEGIIIIVIIIVVRIAQEEMTFGEGSTNECIKVINM